MINESSGSLIASSTFFHCLDAIYTTYFVATSVGVGNPLGSAGTFELSMTVTIQPPLSMILPGRPITVIFTLACPFSCSASLMTPIRSSHENAIAEMLTGFSMGICEVLVFLGLDTWTDGFFAF